MAWHAVLRAQQPYPYGKTLDLCSSLPVVIEIVDSEAKVDAFIPELDSLFEAAQSGGLVTVENVGVLKYANGKR